MEVSFRLHGFINVHHEGDNYVLSDQPWLHTGGFIYSSKYINKTNQKSV